MSWLRRWWYRPLRLMRKGKGLSPTARAVLLSPDRPITQAHQLEPFQR